MTRVRVSKEELYRVGVYNPTGISIPDFIELEGEVVGEKHDCEKWRDEGRGCAICCASKSECCVDCSLEIERGWAGPRFECAKPDCYCHKREEEWVGCKTNCYHRKAFSRCGCTCHRPSKPKIKPLGLLTPEWAADLVETINVLIERENERP